MRSNIQYKQFTNPSDFARVSLFIYVILNITNKSTPRRVWVAFIISFVTNKETVQTNCNNRRLSKEMMCVCACVRGHDLQFGKNTKK